MTPEQRFERIENSLLATAQMQERTQQALMELTETVSQYVGATDARMKAAAELQGQTHQTITDLASTVDRYVQAADARMRRIEENLDGLIRAIMAEHSNGKAKS